MFDVGFWELALLGVIALIVLGPERLPEVARTAGRWVGRIRRYASSFSDELERHTRDVDGNSSITELRHELNQARHELDRARNRIESGARSTIDDIESASHGTEFDDIGEPDEADEADEADEPAAAVPRSRPRQRETAAAEAAAIAGADEDLDDNRRSVPDDPADYADDDPFVVERARHGHGRDDRESGS